MLLFAVNALLTGTLSCSVESMAVYGRYRVVLYATTLTQPGLASPQKQECSSREGAGLDHAWPSDCGPACKLTWAVGFCETKLSELSACQAAA